MIIMKYDFEILKIKEKEVVEWLIEEYAQLQTGRITPVILDIVKVDLYGSKTPIAHLASVSIENPKTLIITPYDNSALQAIEMALREKANFFEVSITENSIRVIAPEITGERRMFLEKIAKEKKEEAKNSLRGVREKIINDIKGQLNDKIISEDYSFALKKELQDKVNKINENIDLIYQKKTEDIRV